MARPPRIKTHKTGLDPTVPFTRAEARAAGLRIAELRGPRFHKVFYDLYVAVSVEVTATLRAQAALKISTDGSSASHFTAAEVLGGCVPDQPRTHVIVPEGNRSERRGIQAHAASDTTLTTTFRGLSITTPEQTFLDLSPLLSLVELVVLGDSLVHLDRTTPDALVAAADGFHGRGARNARRAARLVRAGVDSPMESRLRMLIVPAGLPEPRVNFIIRDVDGNTVVRFDLSYPDLKVIVEYDGRQHARDSSQWGRDVVRREQLDRWGWRLLVVRSPDIYTRPDLTLSRLLELLRERGARHLPGKLRTEWQQHFPVRSAA